MNILLVSTSSYAGMGPYASEIINSLHDDDVNKFYFFLLEDGREYYSKNLTKEALKKTIIIKRNNSKLNKLCDLLISPKTITRKILSLCEKNEIDIVHLLTVDPICSQIIGELSSRHRLFYTIHDLNPHEIKKAFYKKWRNSILLKKADKMIQRSNNLITNSICQYEELKLTHKTKNIYFHEFPSLISHSVKNGDTIPSEATLIQLPYILFFGRIEEYKGVDLLYKAFISNYQLYNNYQLIIAGAGEIYFDRDVERENNILFMNRYIHDSEISYLYKNAECVVYPYISASQSGVLSLACYFNTPMLVSDVSFFKTVEKEDIGLTFEMKNQHDLSLKLESLLQMNTNGMKARQNAYYSVCYDSVRLQDQLKNIYNSFF